CIHSARGLQLDALANAVRRCVEILDRAVLRPPKAPRECRLGLAASGYQRANRGMVTLQRGATRSRAWKGATRSAGPRRGAATGAAGGCPLSGGGSDGKDQGIGHGPGTVGRRAAAGGRLDTGAVAKRPRQGEAEWRGLGDRAAVDDGGAG